jgi:dihydroorotase-like cyclic amidohydrolase
VGAAEKHGFMDAMDYLTHKPAGLLGVELPSLSEGSRVQGIVYQRGLSAVYQEKDIVSKSKNSCFLGETFDTEIVSVIKGDQIVYQR